MKAGPAPVGTARRPCDGGNAGRLAARVGGPARWARAPCADTPGRRATMRREGGRPGEVERDVEARRQARKQLPLPPPPSGQWAGRRAAAGGQRRGRRGATEALRAVKREGTYVRAGAATPRNAVQACSTRGALRGLKGARNHGRMSCGDLSYLDRLLPLTHVLGRPLLKSIHGRMSEGRVDGSPGQEGWEGWGEWPDLG